MPKNLGKSHFHQLQKLQEEADRLYIAGASAANQRQVGGNHYKDKAIQPWDAILDWHLGYLDGTIIKYLARWKQKNGVEDLKKAAHYLEKLIEVESAKVK